MLISLSDKFRINAMKKHLSEFPVETILCAAKKATQQAAINAVKAGRNVYGWDEGKLVKYGPGALPLSQEIREAERSDVRAV